MSSAIGLEAHLSYPSNVVPLKLATDFAALSKASREWDRKADALAVDLAKYREGK